jgi:hypothetical protein
MGESGSREIALLFPKPLCYMGMGGLHDGPASLHCGAEKAGVLQGRSVRALKPFQRGPTPGKCSS